MKLREMDNIRAWIRKNGPGEQGIALISVILLIMVLSFVSAATIVTSITELKIGGNFKTSVQALYNAEAGWQYALGQIRYQYSAGTLTPAGSSVLVRYLAPDPSIYPLLSNNKLPFSNWTTTYLTLKPGTTTDYTFPATGYYANSNTSIQVLLRMSPPLAVKGMFANSSLGIANSMNPCSPPTPQVGLNNSSSVTVGAGGNACPQLQQVNLTTPTDPDPLGATNLVSSHSYFASNNINNTNAAITTGPNPTLSTNTTLQPGNYYLKSLTNANLTISGSGPVNIYVSTTLAFSQKDIIISPGSGPLTIYYHGTNNVDLKQANLNYSASPGLASNLAIIADTSATFDFQTNGHFSGLFYAPNGTIICNPNAKMNGLIWANNIQVSTNLTLTYDPSVETLFKKLSTPKLISWKQL